MLSADKIEEIKKYSHKEFWERLQQLNQATQRTEKEEAELILLREEVFPRWRQAGVESYNSDESVSYRKDVEELDELMDEIEPKFDKVNYRATIFAGSEGFVMNVLSPDFERYRKTKALMYRNEVKI